MFAPDPQTEEDEVVVTGVGRKNLSEGFIPK